MKYLVITSSRGNLPPERAGAIFQAGKDWLNARVADGTLDFVHGFPAGGGVAIASAESHEAFMEQIRGLDIKTRGFVRSKLAVAGARRESNLSP